MKKILTFMVAILFNFNVQAQENNMSNSKSLVVYFSKTGEQYSVGNISEGNTAIIAKMIAKKTGADLFEVKVKDDSYPKAYKALTEVALKEKQANARPEVDGDVANFEDYDVVFLGSPNWWADMPMVLYSFIESEGSGLSSIPSKIKSATNAEVLDGFEVYGHVAQNKKDEASAKVDAWLKKLGL